MSKFLLLLTLCLFVVGCDGRYPSMEQAIAGCEKWAANEKWNTKEGNIFRICQNEKETSQVLGYEERMDNLSPEKPVKHFRY